MRLFVLSLILAPLAFGQAASVLPGFPKAQFFDNDGHPLAGGLVHTYAAGTSTPLDTWPDSTATPGSENTNPVQLDGGGRANIWLSVGVAYKIVLATSGDATIWTVDNVFGSGSGTAPSGGNPFSDADPLVKNAGDDTKLFRIDLSGLSTATTRVVAPPLFDGTLATLDNSQTFSGTQTFDNVTITGTCTGCSGGSGGAPFSDASPIIKNDADPTKLLIFDASNITTGVTRVLAAQNADYTIAATDIRQVFEVSAGGQSILQLRNTSNTGYSALEFLDNTGASRGLVGYANPGAGIVGGNFIIGTNGASPASAVNFYVNGTVAAQFDTNGNFQPLTTSTYTLGGVSNRWSTIYGTQLNMLNGCAGCTDQQTSNASSDLTLTTSYVDVPGQTVTMAHNGTWIITASVYARAQIDGTTSGNDTISQLVINGTPQTGVIACSGIGGTNINPIDFKTYNTCSRTWVYTNIGSNVAKIQSKKGATGAATILQDHSNITAVWIHQ